ncbi:carboxypeptidase-like regulatory domain-containing protein, partial [Flavobacteriaceae bacterium]|nr:carboxypeptidase-like regulatory domain-containing protein [Flavobacteriaceae bacterium]
MRKIIFIFLLVSFCSFSQNNNEKFIEGIVYNDNSYSIEGVHVLNITSNQATITNSQGNFKILVKLNDELIFSAIQFKRKKITMNQYIFDSLSITIYLEEFVNELDEVILNSSGLSGSLMNDLQNSRI